MNARVYLDVENVPRGAIAAIAALLDDYPGNQTLEVVFLGVMTNELRFHSTFDPWNEGFWERLKLLCGEGLVFAYA